MAKKREMTMPHLNAEAARYAQSYFDPAEQARILSEHDQPLDADYVLLMKNRFVPLDAPSADVLRRFVQGETLDALETSTLRKHWRALDASVEQLVSGLEADGLTRAIKDMARRQAVWPAVGVADSEAEMQALLLEQFEQLRQNDVAWRGVDSSTYAFPMHNGIYVLVDWFWHG